MPIDQPEINYTDIKYPGIDMKETRLTIARREYAKGNLEHIYVREFLSILKNPPKLRVKKRKKPEVKKEMKKDGK